MATYQTIGYDNRVFIGCDTVLTFDLPVDAEDPASWTVLFDVRKKDSSSVAIVQASAVIVGLQAVVTLTDDDMNKFYHGRVYRYSVKRMDEGSETVLYWGDFRPLKATAP